MLYIDYEILKAKYLETQWRYDGILSEKEKMFTKTQPKAVQYDKEKVTGGLFSNSFDDYLMEKERKHIDERILEIKSLLDEREQLLKRKEVELRSSKRMQDRIYVFRYLEGMRVYRIAHTVGYSESQVYRILATIDQNIHNATKCEKICDILIE